MSTNDSLRFSNDDCDVVELRVSGVTAPKELAGSIMHHLSNHKTVRLSAIGHQAIGQAVKSVPIASGHTAPHGFVLAIVPHFEVKSIENKDATLVERTACFLTVVKVRVLQ